MTDMSRRQVGFECTEEYTPVVDPTYIRQYLQTSNNHLINGCLNLTFLKRVVESLPDYIPVNTHTKKILDEISAIVFHTSFPLNAELVKQWFDEHGYEVGDETSIPADKRITNLLDLLGLAKKREPIKRRI